MSAAAAPPPAVLFEPPEDERLEQEKIMEDDRKEEARRKRDRDWRGKIGWIFAAVFGVAAVAEAITITGLLPLQKHHHWFTHFTADNVVTTTASSNDLPLEKSEQLILATAAEYVRRCEKWNWFEVAGEQGDYAVCHGLSAGQRQKQYAEFMDNKNPKSPERVYKREGNVRSYVGTPVRTAPNAIRVPYLKVSQKPGERPVQERLMMHLDYVPVVHIPLRIRKTVPLADILFVRATPDVDPQAQNAGDAAQ